MGLYLDSGYLNQEWINEQADKNGISFIVEIGGRQIGKTYGLIEFMLQHEKTFVLMRRTDTEVEFITHDINSPFQGHKPTVKIKRSSKYLADMIKDGDEPKQIGSVIALSSVAKIRGFNGSEYTDLFFDEFIPENHVRRIKDEGDAFLNAVVTLSGNRELTGEKPLRVWLLANPNKIDSDILRSLNIQSKVEEMERTGKELSILSDRGIMIIKPKSEAIMAKRKKTALFKAIGSGSKFEGMAIENSFSYDDTSDCGYKALTGYRLLCAVNGVGMYKKKSAVQVYFDTHITGTPKASYVKTEKDIKRFKRDFPELKSLWVDGCVEFQTLTVKSNVIDFIV